MSLTIQLPTFSDVALVNLYKYLSQWLRNHGDEIGKKHPEYLYTDLERKRTKILKELHARGYSQHKELKKLITNFNTKLKRTYDV